MITKDTLSQLLALLGFSSSGKSFRKTFGNAEIVVDFNEKSIAYPKTMQIHGATTCNFSASENFVVLECVCRLLEKGTVPAEGAPTFLLRTTRARRCCSSNAKRQVANSIRRGTKRFKMVANFSATLSKSAKPSFCVCTLQISMAGYLPIPATSSLTAITRNILPTIRYSRVSGVSPMSRSVMPSGATPTSWTTQPRVFLRATSSHTTSARTNTC